MSSAILYLAIVGIWAVVLVPRWLRPPQASGTLESNLAEPVEAGMYEDLADPEEADPEEDEDDEEGFPDPDGQAAGWAGTPAAERRERILQARRRALTTLIVITAGAVAIAAAHLAAPWVVIPPAVMLAGFVLLLREAARIEAERARAAASRQAAGQRQQAAEEDDRARAQPPIAKIIDISGRVGDQLYDQYADAETRAVGD